MAGGSLCLYRQGGLKIEGITLELLQKELAAKQLKIEHQEKELKRTKEVLNELLSIWYWRGPNNYRDAGRRSIITDRLKEEVRKLKNEGKTIKAVAHDLKISVGTVHKILHM
jgi:DNA-binding NarL/FixJ family response regulator